MNNIEKKLNNLPKAKLSILKDVEIRFKLYRLMFAKQILGFRENYFLRILRPLPIAIFVIFFTLGFVPIYVYASPGITRQHALYPVKQVMEEVEIKLASSPEEKVEVYSKMATRRLEEAEYLSKEEEKKYDSDVLRETIEEAVSFSVNAEQEIIVEGAFNENGSLVEEVNKAKESQTKNLEIIAQNIGLSVKDSTLDSIAVAFDRFKVQNSQINSRVQYEREKNEKLNNQDNLFLKEDKISTSSGEQGVTSFQKVKIVDNEETTTVQQKLQQEIKTYNGQEDVKTQLEQVKNNISNLKADLDDTIYPKEEANNLINRLNDRIEKVESSIEADDVQKISGQLKSIEALTNNGKHFLKKRNVDETEELKNQFLEKQNELNEKYEDRILPKGNINSRNRGNN